MKLNERLAKRQGVTPKQRKKLAKLYPKLSKLFKRAETALDVDKPAISAKLTKLEFKLQKCWNFPLDANFHSYWNKLPGCLCPRGGGDNEEAWGHHRIITITCPYHGSHSKV